MEGNDIGREEGKALGWSTWEAVALQRRGRKGLCDLGTPVEGRDE